MSSSTEPALQNFFVYAPDKTEPGTFERRLSVRPQHIEAIKKKVEAKIIRVGGVLLTPESVLPDAAEKKMIGSTLVCSVPTIEDARKLIEEDIYYTSGVWDAEKIVILPFVAATALPN